MGDLNSQQHTVLPPPLANRIMTILLPERFLNNVLGDLEEEFYLIAEKDVQQAKNWYWRQSMETSLIYFKKKFGTVEFLGRVNFYLPLTLFVIILALISVLSNLSDPEFISPTFWDELLRGEIHTALFSANFWANFWSILRSSSVNMVVDVPSFIIATVNIAILLYMDKKQNASALKLTVWGYTLAFIPYIWSLIHIGSHDFQPKQIGPIIAVGVISALYMLLPVSYLVHRKLKIQKSEQIKKEQELKSKE